MNCFQPIEMILEKSMKFHKENLYIKDYGNFVIIKTEKCIVTLSTLAEHSFDQGDQNEQYSFD